MGKVKSFNLPAGTRVGNYRVIEVVGRGWEGEVYKVAEVPTDSIRALKLFRANELDSIRHLVHFAWYYEQLRTSGNVPIYYHWGQWFLDDDEGCWFLVFEFVQGESLKDKPYTEELFFDVAIAMTNIHSLGYAVGDISMLTNITIRDDGTPVFIDCNPGKPDHPNRDFRADCLEELPAVAKAMFGSKVPVPVRALLENMKSIQRFTYTTLARLLEDQN